MARSLQSLVHWPSMVGQGSDGPSCNRECPMLQPSCLPSSQTSIFISASQGKVSCGLPTALVLAPGSNLQAWVGLALCCYRCFLTTTTCCPEPVLLGHRAPARNCRGHTVCCPPYQPSLSHPWGLTFVLFSRSVCEVVGLCPVSGWLDHKG